MSFSRKHFELIAATIKCRADVIRQALPADCQDSIMGLATLGNLAREFSINLSVENPRFDRERFMLACGFGMPRYRVGGSKKTYAKDEALSVAKTIFERTGNVVAVEEVRK